MAHEYLTRHPSRGLEKPGIWRHAAGKVVVRFIGKSDLAVFLPAFLAAWLVCSDSLQAQPESRPATSVEQLLKSPGVRQGLCVHVGCADGKLTAQMHQGGKYVVHGVDPDPASIQKARQHIQSRGIYGPVSVDCRPMDRLPYTSDTVNVLVVDRLGELLGKGFSIAEAMRVLAPYGVAFLGGGLDESALKAKLAEAGIKDVQIVQADGVWAKVTKPYPAGMDGWEQHQHDAARTGVSNDRIAGPPTGVRWIDGNPFVPWWGYKNVNFVSANGRNFYIMCMGDPTGTPALPGRQGVRVEARDAFNGLKLWEREIEIPGTLYHARSVAAGDRFYTILKRGGPVSALDAATGNVVREYDVRGNVYYHEGTLLVQQDRNLWTAVDSASGKKLWEIAITPPNLRANPVIVADGRVFLLTKKSGDTNTSIFCYDFAAGKELWNSSNIGEGELLLCANDVLVARTMRRIGAPSPAATMPGSAKDAPQPFFSFHAFSAKDGRHLWSGDGASPNKEHVSNVHYDCRPVFSTGGSLWYRDWAEEAGGGQAKKEKFWVVVRDIKTGEVKKRIEQALSLNRCQMDHATVRYYLSMDFDFVDIENEKEYKFYGGRAACEVGYVPANGLVYQHWNYCQCYRSVRGIAAFSADPIAGPEKQKAGKGERLEKGAAYQPGPGPAPPAEGQWPAFRHDQYRSGVTKASVPAELKKRWDAKAGRNVSAPVVADGKVFVSVIDEHRVAAMDAQTGNRLWDYTADAPIDSPPTYFEGLVLFGCRDGFVYSLRASDGALAWRFGAAPEDRRIMVRGRLESAWPVFGSVLIDGGVAYFAAGRHSETDGGIFFCAINPKTGEVLREKNIVRKDALVANFSETGRMGYRFTPPRGTDVICNDVLIKYRDIVGPDLVNMNGVPINVKNGEIAWSFSRSPVKFSPYNCSILDDNTAAPWDTAQNGNFITRKNWSYSISNRDQNRQAKPVEGSLLAVDDGEKVYGVRHWGTKTPPANNSEIFARIPELEDVKQGAAAQREWKTAWKVSAPENTLLKAIIVAGDKVFVACQPGLAQAGAENVQAGEIRIFSAQDGRELGKAPIGASPKFDGLAATPDRLYVSTEDGRVICLGKD